MHVLYKVDATTCVLSEIKQGLKDTVHSEAYSERFNLLLED